MAPLLTFSETAQQLLRAAVAPIADAPVAAPWAPLAQAVEAALGRGETHYTERPGILPLRNKVKAVLSIRFPSIQPASDVLITCGVIEARFVVLQQVIGAGDLVWSAPFLLNRIAGAVLVRRAELAQSAEGAKLVYLASSLGETVLRDLLQTMSPEAFVLFEIDELSSTFHPAQMGGLAERTITIGALGYASWQMGYLLAPAQLGAGLREFKQALTICSTNLSQWAALAAIKAA